MWVESLVSLAAKRVLNVLSCEELRKLPKNIQYHIRCHMFPEEQHHIFKNVWAKNHRGECLAGLGNDNCNSCCNTAVHRGECPCFYGFDYLLEDEGVYFETCPGSKMLSLKFLAVAAVHKILTPEKLKMIPQELHVMFRERMWPEEQLKFFGDYKQCDWTQGLHGFYTLISYEKKCRLLKIDIYEEGKLEGSRSYSHNTPKGTSVLTTYYDNGEIWLVKSSKNFQDHGPHSNHNFDGTLDWKCHYWNDKQHGMSIVTTWNPTRPIYSFHKNDVQVWGFWDILGIYWSMTSCGQTTDS